MTLTCVSDWHLGAIRSAGTTPVTAYQLRLDLLAAGEEILHDITGDLLINGDLFDGPDIPRSDLLRAVQIFGDWLQRNHSARLWAANGNHDLDKNSTRLSSFQFFVALLFEMYGDRVQHIAEGTYIEAHDAYVIPHVANQDLFDLELAKVPDCSYLFVHANYDNGFAVESDHSLNMSKIQAECAPAEHIVFGHVHQQDTALDGKVVLVGNQFPSSVSDCLGNSSKQMVSITSEGLEFETTWAASGDFLEIDWRSLNKGIEDCLPERFIRATGTATAAEADKLVTTLARFRKDAKALVITNAVKIEGVDDAAQLALSHEEITSFNVRAALQEYMGPVDWARIEELEKEAS